MQEVSQWHIPTRGKCRCYHTSELWTWPKTGSIIPTKTEKFSNKNGWLRKLFAILLQHTYTANQWSDELQTVFHIAGGVVPDHVFHFIIVKIHTWQKESQNDKHKKEITPYLTFCNRLFHDYTMQRVSMCPYTVSEKAQGSSVCLLIHLTGKPPLVRAAHVFFTHQKATTQWRLAK